MDILTPHTPNAAATMSLPLSLDSDRPRTLPVGRKIFGREEIKEMIVLGDVMYAIFSPLSRRTGVSYEAFA